MRVVIQRVSEASVTINDAVKSAVGAGFVVLLGVGVDDAEEDADWLCDKIAGLRVFSDDAGKMNRDLRETGGEVLVISQFTLHASYRKGARPSFIRAARPDVAVPLYERFVARLEEVLGKEVATGTFGTDMKVSLVNDGPVTIVMDSRNRE